MGLNNPPVGTAVSALAACTDPQANDTIAMVDTSASATKRITLSQLAQATPLAGPLVLASDFLSENVCDTTPFAGMAIGSGTVSYQNSTMVTDHPGVIYIASSATNASGYYYSTRPGANVDLGIFGGEQTTWVFRISGAAGGLVADFGFHNGITGAAPTHGAWIDISSTYLFTANIADGTHAASASATTYQGGNETWYGLIVSNSADNTVWTYTLYLCSTGAQLWQTTLTQGGSIYKPTKANCAMQAVGGTGSAIGLMEIDYANITINRVLTR
jgi:hypothetical protein